MHRRRSFRAAPVAAHNARWVGLSDKVPACIANDRDTARKCIQSAAMHAKTMLQRSKNHTIYRVKYVCF
jgi:hypothetical protein